jgi:pentatricopeptide repeat protein
MPKQDLARALANYRLAYKFTPTMSKAYEGAAKVYELMGKKAKAEEERAKDPKNKPTEEVTAQAVELSEAQPAESNTAEPAQPAETKIDRHAKPESAPAVVETKAAEKAPEPAKVAEPAKPAAEPAKTAEPAKAETVVPTDPFEKGKMLLAEGKYKDAAPLWREVLAKKPGDKGAYFYAGVTRYYMGQYDKAEFNLKKGLEYKEEGNDANYYLALIYQKGKKNDLEKKALAAYLKKAAPDAKFRKPAEDRLAEMKAAADSAKVASAAPATEAAAPAKESAPVAEKAAPVETAPAAPVASEAKGPSDTPTIANANLLFKAGSYEAALQMYKALLETEISPDERYFATLQMGNIYRELRDFHSAVTRYRTVVQQYPESDWATEAERALEDAVWLEKHASELPRRAR